MFNPARSLFFNGVFFFFCYSAAAAAATGENALADGQTARVLFFGSITLLGQSASYL